MNKQALEAAAEQKYPCLNNAVYADQQEAKRKQAIFKDGADWFRERVINMLNENYNACKNLTDEDKIRSAQDIVNETYEDMLSIVSGAEWQSGQPTVTEDEDMKVSLKHYAKLCALLTQRNNEITELKAALNFRPIANSRDEQPNR